MIPSELGLLAEPDRQKAEAGAREAIERIKKTVVPGAVRPKTTREPAVASRAAGGADTRTGGLAIGDRRVPIPRISHGLIRTPSPAAR